MGRFWSGSRGAPGLPDRCSRAQDIFYDPASLLPLRDQQGLAVVARSPVLRHATPQLSEGPRGTEWRRRLRWIWESQSRLLLDQLQSQYISALIVVVVEGDRGPGRMSRVRGQLQQFLNNTWSSVVLTIRDRHGVVEKEIRLERDCQPRGCGVASAGRKQNTTTRLGTYKYKYKYKYKNMLNTVHSKYKAVLPVWLFPVHRKIIYSGNQDPSDTYSIAQ